MRLSDYKKDYDHLTGKASDVARQLSFAGIAIVWIFRTGQGTDATLPGILLVSLGLFALALLSDLSLYIIASIIWGRFHRCQEKKLTDSSEDPDLEAPAWYNRPAIVLFALKLASVAVGYAILVTFFVRLSFS